MAQSLQLLQLYQVHTTAEQWLNSQKQGMQNQ